MSRITALDWLNGSLRLEDLSETRAFLGLNKRAKEKHSKTDAIDNISSAESFAATVRDTVSKNLKIPKSEIEIEAYKVHSHSKIMVSFYLSDNGKGVMFHIPTEDEREEDKLIGMFGVCLFDEVVGTTRACTLEGDESVAPDETGLYVPCGEMYPCNDECLGAMVQKLKKIKAQADHGDFSSWLHRLWSL